jgi:predicted nucleic acid-binding protein
MPFGAVLDACVLYPFSLCDLLLRLADRELYDLYWSRRILDELARNLVRRGLTHDQAAYRMERMRAAFPNAEVSDVAVARLEPQMTNDQKDRHVLAAAIVADADAIVTFNLRHFPADACGPFGVEVLHPDTLLADLHDLDREVVEDEIFAQASALRRPPVSVMPVPERLSSDPAALMPSRLI